VNLPFADWLPHQRWYAGRQRSISSADPVAVTPLRDGLDHMLLSVRYTDGGEEHYQVFVDWDHPPMDGCTTAMIGVDGDRTGYDALFEPSAAQRLLAMIESGARFGDLGFIPEPDATLPVDAPARVLDAEQSNTSVVFDRVARLKVFRRILPGINPDLELNRVLARAGSTHVARLLGAIEGDLAGQPVSLGMVTAYADSAVQGWAMATASAQDLDVAGDLRADQGGGDFAAESSRLGEAVAAVHQSLAAELGSSIVPMPIDAMIARLAAATAVVPELAVHADAALATYEAARTAQMPVQRVHGDLHLGQVLRTPDTWLLIDFEGEPGETMAARRRRDSVLRDVAGMLRSYEYAACQLLGEREDRRLSVRARQWIDRNESAFCRGYATVAGFDPREQPAQLAAYELDKAVYEAVYECRQRPSWAWIPRRSIARLLGAPLPALAGG
jgi:maltokinase